MAEKITDGRRVLAGTHGKLWIDNVLVASMTEVSVTIDIDREDIQWGLGKYAKMVGMTGSGSITLDKVYSTIANYHKQLSKGYDVLVKLTFQIQDPDSVGGQIERVTIPNCWFNNLPLTEISKGAKMAESYDFGFNATEISFEEEIK